VRWSLGAPAEITKLLLDRLARRLRAQRIEVAFSDDAVELLAREGFDPGFGARPLRRTIQRLVENELSRMVLGGRVEPGDRVRVDVVEGDLPSLGDRLVRRAQCDVLVVH
jgi:ATP-dependent Clp protease ATP-binding subunit ClpC